MKEYQDYYIAFIDILGFKQLINDKSCNEIAEIYDSIRHIRILYKIIGNGDNEKSEPIIPISEINFKVMSDSVCIYIKANIQNSLLALVFICMDFQSRMLEFKTPILLRGAITKGQLFSEDDIVFGPGFVKAYTMEEKNASVPRIIITKEIIDEYNHLSKNKLPDNILIRDYDAFYYVEYISAYGLTDRSKMGKYDEVYEYIESVLGSTIDDSVRNKFLYLESKILPLINKRKNL